MSFIDSFANFIHESSLMSTSYNDSMYRQFQGFNAVDKQIGGYNYFGKDPQGQVNEQTRDIKNARDFIFQRVDTISNHHIATSIKNSIIGDCFHALCDRTFVNIQYRLQDDEDEESYKETNRLFNKDIKELLKKTYFLEVFKSCLINDGMNYGEIFLSTECKVGEGIISLGDDISAKKHLAIYKNLSPIGYIKFKSINNEINPKDMYIDPDEISHFIVNPQKIPLEISYDLDNQIELPEKVMCALPLLTPVIDLIIQYNALEYLSTGVEMTKALAPTILGVGVSPNSDMTEITRQLQEYSIALNSTRNNILNNLENIDAKAIAKEIGKIQLIPYSIEEGTNSMKQIVVDKNESNLSEKLNNITRTIAKAMGMPESYLATMSTQGKKEENITTNPQYSRMLSGIQQSLARGIGDFVYKHLKYKYSTIDNKGNVFLSREIDRNCIEVKFQSITNIDTRLDMEQVLLTAETMGNIVGVLDMIAGSPNLPLMTDGKSVKDLWDSMTESIPSLRSSLKIDHALDERNSTISDNIEDYEDDGSDNSRPTDNVDIEKDNKEQQSSTDKPKADKKDIKDIFY